MKSPVRIKYYCKVFLLFSAFTLLFNYISSNLKAINAMNTMEQKVRIPIVMYHQVKYTNLGKDVISPYEFESDLKYYKDKNYNTITMTQLIDYVYNDVELPPNPIILSFDDGYLSTYKNVFPLLKKYDMKIVLSIIGKSTDAFSKVVDNNIEHAHATWDQISEMQESGLVEIQNHSYNLHKICNGRYGCGQKSCESIEDYEKILEEDIMPLQDKIQAVIDVTPNTFTYPYGKFSDTTEAILKKLGFKASLSSTFGVNVIVKQAPDTLFGLKRICRAHNQSIDKLLKHGMDTIKNR